MSCRCEELRISMLELHLSDYVGFEEMMNMLSPFQTPEQLFPFVNALKEEGNGLVRRGKLEMAVQVYKKAAAFLVMGLPCCVQGFHPFRDLVIPLTLNLALCALKLSDFRWVKRLCGCVLKFDTSNVKALFRRGSAAIGLGQLHDAERDLLAAIQVEPANNEIAGEWNRLSKLLGKSTGVRKECSSRDGGMDSGFSNHFPVFNPLKLSANKKARLGKTSRSESVDCSLSEVRSNLMGSNANFQQHVIDPPVQDSVMEDSNSGLPCPFINTNLAEPKRFSNQSRPGSFLTFSPSDYKKLANRETLNYFHPRLVGYMSIRAIPIAAAPTSTDPPVDVSTDHQASSVTSPRETSQDTTCSPQPSPSASDSCSVTSPLSTTGSLVDCVSSVNYVTSNKSRKPRPSKAPAMRKSRARRVGKRQGNVPTSAISGVKRKGLSNSLITSYPLWKRRLILHWLVDGQTAINSAPEPFTSSVMLDWTLPTTSTYSNSCFADAVDFPLSSRIC